MSRPAHAKDFKGAAKNIPERDTFLLPYQARWVKDGSLLKLMEKSRRVGISYATAYEAVREHSLETATWESWVSSRDDSTAKLFVLDCKRFAGALDIAAKDMGAEVLAKDTTSYVLGFANGTHIHSLSSNPDAFAGKGGNVTLDEFALRDDPRQVYAIAKPTIDWGGRLRLISTHRGSQNYFNEMVREIREKDNPKRISLHTVTLQDALDQGFLWKLQTKLPETDERQEMDEAAYWDFIKASCADAESFLQEYCCLPADDNAAFLEYALITAAEYPRGVVWEVPLEECKELFMGVDVGRKKDFTVVWVAEKVGDVYFTRRIIRLRNTTFSDQEKIIWDLIPQMRRCCMDATGLGMQLAERAVQRFPGKVEAVTFTGPLKEALAFPLRGAYEDRRWKIPDDKVLRADLRALRKETTAAGNIRFVAESTEEGHADHFWAQALCQHAGDTVQSSGKFAALGEWAARSLGRTRRRKRRRAA